MFQAVLNFAMVRGLIPVTAVPLTFISYRGSSLLVSLSAIGLDLAVVRRTPVPGAPARAAKAPRRLPF